MSSTDLATFRDFALAAATRAGDAILPHFRRPIVVDDKGGARGYDPVTEADRAAEMVIRDAITARYPDHGILGEEHGRATGTAPWTWVIDPIDGTRSFITGQLHWATLIALRDTAKPRVGVVHQPFVGETFHAIDGGPALWTRAGETRTLTTRQCARVEDAILACTTPDMFKMAATRGAFDRVSTRARLTRFGGDCYAYCLLAMGLIDVVVESSLQPYDVQAVMTIIGAAGGVMTAWDGGACDDGGNVVACGDPALHPRVMALLAG
ncbi:MAG: histidinol-phosphatase [Proteobacteria bacterium]|nr:histidinol-phosphatase [Pseudomonadota bacterium]